MRATGEADDRLVEAWVELLGRDRWEWFITLTFREPVHPEGAWKRFREFVERMQARRESVGMMEQTDVRWMCAMERQRRGVVHFHALLGNVGVLRYQVVREVWRDGFTWVESIGRAEDAARYCAKYVLKGGELEVGEGVASSRWPRRVVALRKLARCLSVLDEVERERVVEWALRDRRPSTRPDALLERARLAGQGSRGVSSRDRGASVEGELVLGAC